MSTSAEKLVKQTIKLLAKSLELDYDELKLDAKKVVKMARNFDESLLGLMEELLDLGNIGSQEELEEFGYDTLKVYCKIKEIDDSGSERSLRARVWQHIEEEFELESDDDEEDSDVSDDDEEEIEILPKIVEVEPETEPEKIKKKKKKEIVIE
jgi:hypothetical protein